MNWQKVKWFDGVESLLSDALLDDEDIIRKEVDQGIATLWSIEKHGYFVTRLEAFEHKKELVLVAWQGKNTEPLINYLKESCKKAGIDSMRFHSSLPEKLIARFVRPWGFCRVESVYRVEL